MSAFILIDTKIKNPEPYEEYKALAKPIAEKYGGQYRVRGGHIDVLQTELWNPTRLVIVEFPDMESARAFMNDEGYASVKKIREENADCTTLILEGF